MLSAFAGGRKVAQGDRDEVLGVLVDLEEAGDGPTVLVFDDATGTQVELDPRTVPAGLASPGHRSPGRPRLGVVGREVTLLPRHWEWLGTQPGGASATLRRLVEQASRDGVERDRVRRSQEASFRFMSAIAGNEPGFEEACRALFAADPRAFDLHTAVWPTDVREYARALAADALVDGG